MPIIGMTPGTGKGFTTYTREKVPPKSKRLGYLAGNVHGLVCHTTGQTKPCLKHLVNRNKKCALCDEHRPIDWRGYVPLRDESGKPVTVIITALVADVVDKIKPGSAVMWGRGEDKFDSVWVMERSGALPWSRWWPDKQPADDMAPWLCALWKMPEVLPLLRTHFAKVPQAAVTEAEALPTAIVDETDPAVRALRKVMKTKPASELTAGEAVEVNRVMDYLTVPSGNGKHKSK